MESLAALTSSELPSARQSILGSFLRGRPRGVSQSHPSPPPPPPPHDNSSRDSPPPNTPSDSSGHRRRPAAIQASTSQSLQPSPSLAGGAFSQMLRRRRSAGALASNTTSQAPQVVPVARTAAPALAGSSHHNSNAPQHRIRLVPHLDSRRSLKFEPISRDVREGDQPLRIGRFTDRSGLGLAAANALGSNKLAFKSKVVSRAHAEIWAEAGGKFYIRDTKSSSGTFLNHVRLSAANAESGPNELKDGDLLQLGVDYQGGTEDIYKCVKIKVEVGREWQAHSNPFNTNALKQLKEIAISPATGGKKPASNKTTLPDCCICLFSVTIQQALFIAPCSHAFHYKCIRPLLELHHPSFSCPLCRTFANLEEDVEVDIEPDEASIAEASAIIASVAAAVTPIMPSTNPIVSHGEHSRERPDAGAETEVEQDGNGSRLVASLRRRPVPTFHGPVVDLTEDADEEMLDESALPALPEDAMDGLEDNGRRRELSVSPVSAGRNNRSAELLFEPDGEASGSGEADAGASGSDISGHEDGILNNKRKR